MNILVTGCMGFIGSNLVPQLLNSLHTVIGFDNLSNTSIDPTGRMKKAAGKYWPGFKFYKIDVNNTEHMKTILVNERKIDAVVHLAAMGSVPRSFASPIQTIHVNCTGFASIMYTAKMFGIKNFVYASSSSVYGDNKDLVKIEGREGNPLNPYALSKQVNEKFAEVWGVPNGLNCTGLRFFNVYGPGQKTEGAYASVIPRFLTSEKPVVYGDGSATRDFTYVDDVCEAIHNAIIRPMDLKNPTHTILNVGAGRGTKVKDLLKLIRKEDLAEFKDERCGDIKTSIADTNRIQNVLNFVPQTKIEDGLIKTNAYYESI